MSIIHRAVFMNAQSTRPTDLLVLLCIAEHYGKNGDPWPSIDRIAEWTRLKRRAVTAILRRLEVAGDLEVVVRHGRGGTNRYRLLMLDHPEGKVHGDASLTPLVGADNASENMHEEAKKRARGGQKTCTTVHPKEIRRKRRRTTVQEPTLASRASAPAPGGRLMKFPDETELDKYRLPVWAQKIVERKRLDIWIEAAIENTSLLAGAFGLRRSERGWGALVLRQAKHLADYEDGPHVPLEFESRAGRGRNGAFRSVA